MRYLQKTLIWSATFFLCLPCLSEPNELGRARLQLQHFKFANINSTRPPCRGVECKLIWATAAIAVGDFGEYARRVQGDDVAEFGKTSGMTQNFSEIKRFTSFAKVSSFNTDKSFNLTLVDFHAGSTHAIRVSVRDLVQDERPVVPIAINGVPANAMLDTGARLSIPSGSAAEMAIRPMPLLMNSTGGAGGIATSGVSVAEKIEIGPAVIRQAGVLISPNAASTNNRPVIGYDMLFHFDAVGLDLRKGSVELNPARARGVCKPMTLILDRNMLPAGIATTVTIMGEPYTARIDTGANMDVLLHGSDVLSSTPFTPINGARIFDATGRVSEIASATVDVTWHDVASPHLALRTELGHPDFDVTLGIKFFIGKYITFDFRNHQFCID